MWEVAVDQMSLGFQTRTLDALPSLAGTVFTALEVPAAQVPELLTADHHHRPAPAVRVVSCGFATPADITHPAAGSTAGLVAWRRSVELAVAAGSPYLSVYVPPGGAGADDAALVRRLDDLRAVARAAGLEVLVEFADLATAVRTGSWERLRTAADGLIVDLAALAVRGGWPATVNATLADDVRWFHVADVAEHSAVHHRRRRLPPGDGTVPLAAMITDISGGRPAPLSLEVTRPDATPLGSWLGQLDRAADKLLGQLHGPRRRTPAPEVRCTTHDLTRRITRQFLGEPAESAAPLLGGATSELFLVTVRDRRYVLRRHRRDQACGRSVATLNVARYAAGQNLPVPRQVLTTDGTPIVRFHDDAFSMSTYAAGRPLDYGSVDDLRAAARLLARWHVRMAGCAPPVVEGPLAALRSPNEVTDRIDRTLRSLTHVDPATRAALTWADRWLSARGMVDWWAGPTTVCHGDFHGGNLIFGNRSVVDEPLVTLVDFDNVDRLPAALDLGYALLMLGRRGRGEFVLQRTRVADFLREYSREGIRQDPATAEELTARLRPWDLVAGMVVSQIPEPGLLACYPAGHPGRARLLRSNVVALQQIRHQLADVVACAEDVLTARSGGGVGQGRSEA